MNHPDTKILVPLAIGLVILIVVGLLIIRPRLLPEQIGSQTNTPVQPPTAAEPTINPNADPAPTANMTDEQRQMLEEKLNQIELPQDQPTEAPLPESDQPQL